MVIMPYYHACILQRRSPPDVSLSTQRERPFRTATFCVLELSFEGDKLVTWTSDPGVYPPIDWNSVGDYEYDIRRHDCLTLTWSTQKS